MEIQIYDVFISSLRWLIGMVAGVTVGTLLGVGMFYWGRYFRVLPWLLHFLRALPVLGLVPVIQYSFGINEGGKFLLISWAVTFPVWISTQAALASRLPELEIIIGALGVPARDYLRCYVVPRLFSGILQGAQIAIGVGWLSVVAAEFIGTFTSGFWAGGIGYKLFLAFDLNDWHAGILALLIFGMLGLVSSLMWEKIARCSIVVRRGFDPLIWIKHG